MTKGEIAKGYFLQGLNCSQAVALAFAKELKKSEDEIKKAVIGFGGGFGRQRLVCGAVSGMTYVLGSLKSDGNDRAPIYKIIQDACAEIKNELGSLICGELLEGKVEVNTSYKPDLRTEEYYKKRPCAEIVEIVANFTDKYLK
jgi:C_GCAxxG_C_C family probable redox protein